CARSYGPFDYW
nr:immunoglobulin heavy chain junction region [Mus musculus]MBK4196648.1 immunoglobulin heavy chain junction region [Mus musculus]MBK4196650.1 immunoglobulin heavy chain junction region [Mus musculus]